MYKILRICVSAAAVCMLISVSSCSAGGEAYTYDFFAADTFITLKLYGADEPAALCAEVETQTAVLEKILSRNDAESELAKINASPAGDYSVSDALAEVVSASLAVAALSGGAYDPTVAPLVELWDIGHGGERIPEQAEIEAALDLTGYDNVKLEGNTLSKLTDFAALDLGGAGKGYMLGKVAELLEKSGGWGIISFGGNIGVYGVNQKSSTGAADNSWNIAIKDPRDADALIGAITVESGFVSVSGDYERYFIADGKRYCHIFDPSSGWPADNGVWSVAVWSADALYGDLTSTALFVMGKERGLEYCEQNGIAALFVTADGIFCSKLMGPMFNAGK